jgi:hypothetical protein
MTMCGEAAPIEGEGEGFKGGSDSQSAFANGIRLEWPKFRKFRLT